MKKFSFKKIAIFTLGVFFCSVFLAHATSPDDLLKQSLMSLRESVRKIYYENRKLEANNKILMERIEKFKKEYQELSQKRADLVAGVKNVNTKPPAKGKDSDLYSKKVTRLKKDLDYLTTEQKEYKDRLEEQYKDGLQRKNSLENNKKVIHRLESKLEELDSKLSSDRFKNEIVKLKNQIEDYQKIYIKEEKKLNKWKRKYKRPSENIEKLEKEYQEMLKIKEEAQSILDGQKKAEVQLQKEVDLLKEEDKKRFTSLGKEIDALKKEKSGLQKVLLEAKNKIETNQLDFKKVLKQEKLLKENLRIIRNDNAFLRETLESLENELKVYQGK